MEEIWSVVAAALPVARYLCCCTLVVIQIEIVHGRKEGVIRLGLFNQSHLFRYSPVVTIFLLRSSAAPTVAIFNT